MISLDTLGGLERIAGICCDRIGTACWQGGLFIGAVWILSRLVPAMPISARRWLWWIACLNLILRLVWTTPISLPLREIISLQDYTASRSLQKISVAMKIPAT